MDGVDFNCVLYTSAGTSFNCVLYTSAGTSCQSFRRKSASSIRRAPPKYHTTPPSICVRSASRDSRRESRPRPTAMSAAAEVVSSAAAENLKSQNANEGWTLVLPRRAKNRSKKSQIPKSQSSKIPIPWVPTDLGSSQTDPSTESKLLQKIQLSLKKLESSDFYRALAVQLRTPQILHSISRALSSHLKMPMVIYGIGSIGSYDPPRLQLALAILLQRDFDWIGQIEIFDPVISAVESRVMAALDCSVLSVDEQGRRAAEEPTLFFMPHCEAVLYDNLIDANWRPERLNRMVVFGNSFGHYQRVVSEFKGSAIADSARHVLAVGRFVEEVGIETVSDDFFRAFHETSWHFFDLDPGMDMERVKLERELRRKCNAA